MNQIVIDGKKFSLIEDIHCFLAKEMDFGPFYGKNFSALWDFLSTEVERPIEIKLINSKMLEKKLSENYHRLVYVFEKMEKYDEEMGFKEKFIFTIQ